MSIWPGPAEDTWQKPSEWQYIIVIINQKMWGGGLKSKKRIEEKNVSLYDFF